MKANNSEVFLVNTGWNGKGERISLKNTRLIIDSILNNELDEVDLQNIPIFNLKVPTKVKNIPSELLDPRTTWSSNEASLELHVVRGSSNSLGIFFTLVGTLRLKIGIFCKSTSSNSLFKIESIINLVFFREILSPLPFQPVLTKNTSELLAFIFFDKTFEYFVGCSIKNAAP